MLVIIGGFVTIKFIKPKFEKQKYIIPSDINVSEFVVSDKEKRALWWSGAGLLTALAAVALLGFGPLSSYVDETGKTVTPFLDNIILIITFIFFVPGMFYGYAVGKFRKLSDMVGAMSKQIGTMGYAIVLTFFSYNFLSLLTYTNLGTYITYIGAMGLQTVGASNSPISVSYTHLTVGFKRFYNFHFMARSNACKYVVLIYCECKFVVRYFFKNIACHNL